MLQQTYNNQNPEAKKKEKKRKIMKSQKQLTKWHRKHGRLVTRIKESQEGLCVNPIAQEFSGYDKGNDPVHGS